MALILWRNLIGQVYPHFQVGQVIYDEENKWIKQKRNTSSK